MIGSGFPSRLKAYAGNKFLPSTVSAKTSLRFFHLFSREETFLPLYAIFIESSWAVSQWFEHITSSNSCDDPVIIKAFVSGDLGTEHKHEAA